MIENILCGSALVVIDQWTKAFVRTHAAHRSITWGPIRVRFVASTMRLHSSSAIRATLAWFTALAAAMLLHRMQSWFANPAANLSLACAFGGAASNLLDILRHDRVTDFIDLKWWPVFNLADVAIVVGLFVAFWLEI